MSAMKKALAVTVIVVGTTFGQVVRADDSKSDAISAVAALCQTSKGEDKDKKDEWKREPKAEQTVTQHHVTIGGKVLDYTATAGVLVIRDDQDKPIANMGYVAYTKRDVKDLAARPIMFAFNGGPGSSSLWLH